MMEQRSLCFASIMGTARLVVMLLAVTCFAVKVIFELKINHEYSISSSNFSAALMSTFWENTTHVCSIT
jgi:hypothetical protein